MTEKSHRPPRSAWEAEAIKRLHIDSKLRFPRMSDLREIFFDARAQADVLPLGSKEANNVALVRWASSLVDRGYLVKLQRNLYANVSASPYPQAVEAAHLLRPTAIVSAQSVLGTLGIINNTSPDVVAVIRSEGPDGTRPRTVDLPIEGTGATWRYRFVAMASPQYEAGRDEDRLDASVSYPRSTPERALCDLLLLNSMRRVKMETALLNEIDISDLDMDRVGRLVEAMDMKDVWQQFVDLLPAEEVEQYSTSLGL